MSREGLAEGRRRRGAEGGAQVPRAGEEALDEAAAGDVRCREGRRDRGEGPAPDETGVAEAVATSGAARTEHAGLLVRFGAGEASTYRCDGWDASDSPLDSRPRVE